MWAPFEVALPTQFDIARPKFTYSHVFLLLDTSNTKAQHYVRKSSVCLYAHRRNLDRQDLLIIDTLKR